MNAQLKAILPTNLFHMLTDDILNEAEEVRLRINRPIQVVYAETDRLIGGREPTASDMHGIMMKLCEGSLYAHDEEIRSGFITYQGCRVGLCGHAVLENGNMLRMDSIGGINIRLAHEHKGCAKKLLHYFLDESMRPRSTLIVSPPRVGKTTLLRDIARCFSNGSGTPPRRVCIVDERYEIAACMNGAPYFDVGVRTDVIYGARRSEGLMMAIRTLSPEVLITDELGNADDIAAVSAAIGAGVAVIASCHGDAGTICLRRDVKELLDRGLISGVLAIGRNANGLFAKRFIYCSEDSVI